MEAPTLSIVVPVLDGAKTLPACLSALVAAAPPGTEIVVVDDGSTDDTAAIAARYARVLSHGSNRGTSAARNTGWHAAGGDLILFVDADVVVRPDAIRRLVALVEGDATVMGANGGLTASGGSGAAGWYANVSIHFQHLLHGERVASAFTSMCLLRRSTLEAMGGWEEAWHSRYADDVVTRFHLPPGSIAVDHAAQGEHDKRVSLVGLLRHRFWIGWFFVRSLLAHRREVADRPRSAILALRYPVNVLLVLATSVAVLHPHALAALGIVALLNNLAFLVFVARTCGIGHALAAIPLVVGESLAMVAGITASTVTLGVQRWKRPNPRSSSATAASASARGQSRSST